MDVVGVGVDVVGVGHAIVDVIAHVSESFITEHGLAKGVMTIVSYEQSEKLHSAMPSSVHMAGGSAANTVAGLASLGGSAAYIGKVGSDLYGEIFSRQLQSAGVQFTPPGAHDLHTSAHNLPTARCLVQVTCDAERTLNTYLGISGFLSPEDIDTDLVASSHITYCEGYLWDTTTAKQALQLSMATAQDAGRVVAMSLSDVLCVERHRDEWLDLIDDHVDLVFANEHEACALANTDNLDEACHFLASLVYTSAVTQGAQGSTVLRGGRRGIRETIPAVKVQNVVDLTGAGDLYASGFIWGLTQNATLRECGEIASISASQAIQHIGAQNHLANHNIAIHHTNAHHLATHHLLDTQNRLNTQDLLDTNNRLNAR